MRKSLFLAFLMVAAVSATAQQPVDSLGIHPYKPTEFLSNGQSNWSLWLSGGFPMTDFDFGHQQKSPIGFLHDSKGEPAFNLGLAGEYNWNNTFGIGAQYKYHSYQVLGENEVEDLINGRMHQATAFISVDIFNAWRKHQPSKIFALNLMLGGGAAFYKNTHYYPQSPRVTSGNKTASPNPITPDDKAFSDNSYTCVPVVNFGASFEFNVSRSIALGFGAWYNMFTKDDVDHAMLGSNNDGMWDVDLVLRYKINAVKKSHMRNYVSSEAWDEQYAQSHPGYKQYKGATPVDGGSGKRDTLVLFHRDTVVLSDKDRTSNYAEREEREYIKESIIQLGYHYVYFDNGKAIIDNQGLIVIQQVANRMKRDTERYAVLIGYCDNTGSDEINNKLAAQRAQNVYDELTKEYMIEEDRLACFSKGILQGNKSKAAYAPNRRVEIRLVTKDEFERLKKENQEDISAKTSKTTTRAERADIQNAPTQTIKVTANVTLSKLARQYYNNTHCWVYIYQANQDRLNDPSRLPNGIDILIPELTEAQKQITKEQAHDLYLTLRDQD